MKKLLLQIVALLLFNLTSLAQSGWVQQSSGTQSTLLSVFFINEHFGWAAGENGTILHTTNGGHNWNPQTIGTTEHLTSIHFINQMIGWVVGREGTILKTTDGGLNWNICFSPPENVSLFSVYFINDTTGWAVGVDNTWRWGVCMILKTTDGGLSWNIIIPKQGCLFSVHFVDNNNGWAVGEVCPEDCWPIILRTTDGGINWSENSYRIQEGLHSVYFINDTIGWAAGELGIIKSIDGGIHWNLQPSANGWLWSINFTSIDTGWAVGEGGLIVNTTNGGENWVSHSGITNARLHSVYFTDKNTGWIVGDGGLILHTINGGVTFIEEEEINEIPIYYSLSNNFPNPFNPSTKIKYSVPQTSQVKIKVFDVLGNELETLIDEEKPTGTYEITWFAENLPSGVYFYRLRAVDPSAGSGQSFVETKKMLLIR